MSHPPRGVGPRLHGPGLSGRHGLEAVGCRSRVYPHPHCGPAFRGHTWLPPRRCSTNSRESDSEMAAHTLLQAVPPSDTSRGPQSRLGGGSTVAGFWGHRGQVRWSLPCKSHSPGSTKAEALGGERRGRQTGQGLGQPELPQGHCKATWDWAGPSRQ